jgi:hypothetical protein
MVEVIVPNLKNVYLYGDDWNGKKLQVYDLRDVQKPFTVKVGKKVKLAPDTIIKITL